jgi:hypothetical protein
MNMRNTKAPFWAGLLLITVLACNINNPRNLPQPSLELTVTVQALSIQQTSQVQTQTLTVVGVTETSTQIPPSPTDTAVPPSATPQEPMVIHTTLCWLGPGAKYDVVSSVNQGQVVEVIGRGSVAGWYIIRNPRYNDPCWIQASDMQLDAGLDINALKVFNPPPLPTNTPKPTPVPSSTPV